MSKKIEPKTSKNSVLQKENKTPFRVQQNKYLYCIIKDFGPEQTRYGVGKSLQKPQTRAKLGAGLVQNQKLRFGSGSNISGQDGKEIYAINEENLVICVSDTSKEEYGLIKEHLICHQKVIEGVMKKGYDVLPFRFGTIAKGAEEIREKILRGKRKELLETFPIVEGRIEQGLRAFWKDMPSIFQEIVKENPEIQQAKKEAQKNPLLMKIASVGELIQKALEAKRESEAEKILSPLKKLAVDFKARELLRHSEPMKDSMIFSSAFLVSKERAKEFDKKIEAFSKEYDQRIKFIYLSPLPPFNFVELSLEA